MTELLGLAGSLRRRSYNRGLLRASVEVGAALQPEPVRIVTGDIGELPLYNGDLEEAEGLPEAVLKLQAQLAAADGLLIVTPEYNGGMPGVLKNAIDWMSRGSAGLNAFKDKPVAVIGASPGGFGTIMAQNHWLQVLRRLGMAPWFGGQVMVARAGEHFDAEGNLADPEQSRRLGQFLADFAASIAR